MSRARAPRSTESRALSRARARAFWDDPENRAKQSRKTKNRMARPGVSERISARTKEALARPEVRARQLAGLERAWAAPEARARQSEITKTAMAKWRAERLEAAATALQQMPRADREAALAGLANAARGGAK